MTPDPTLAIESVIPDGMRDVILDRHPSQRGATVADLLDIASDNDTGLEHTEPAWEEFGADVVTVVLLAHPSLGEPYVTRLVGLSMLAIVLADEAPVTEHRTRDIAAEAALYAVQVSA